MGDGSEAMLMLVYRQSYGGPEDFKVKFGPTLKELLKVADEERLLRSDYGARWWIAEPLMLVEQFMRVIRLQTELEVVRHPQPEEKVTDD